MRHHNDVGEEDDGRHEAVVLVDHGPQVHASRRRRGHRHEGAPDAIVDALLGAEADVDGHGEAEEAHGEQRGVLDQGLGHRSLEGKQAGSGR